MDTTAIEHRVLADLAIPSAVWSIPVLIGIFGVPGTGKTYCAQTLAQRYPLLVLSTDAIRLHYGLASGPATHAVMYRVAATLLIERVGIIFDGIPMRRTHRRQMHQFAAEHGAACGLIHTTADPEVIERRLARRRDDPERTTGEGKFVVTPEHFARIATWLEVPAPDEGVWEVDTSADEAERQITRIDRWLGTLVAKPPTEP